MKQEILSSSSHSEPGEQIFECKAEVLSLPSGKPSAESERNYGRFHVNNIPDFTTSRHSANQNMHPDCANRNSSMRNPTSANPNLNCSQKSPTHVNIGHTQILNSDDPQRLLPTPFLSKTYQLVDDTASDEVVSWNKNGTTFVVWCPAEFAKDILPNYFKHNNFSSFVRQLNTYGFRKVVPDRWEFAHDCFRKGEKHLLIEIHRRKPGVLPSKPSTSLHKQFTTPPTTSTSEQATSSGSSPLSSQLEKSAHIHIDEADKLKKENMLLVSELSCLRRLCSDLLLYIQRHAKNPTGFTSPVESLLQSKSILQDTSLYKSFWASDKRTGTDMDSVDEAKEEGSGCEFYRSKNVDDGENCEFHRSKNVDNGEDDLDLRLVLAQASWCKESYGCNGNGATKCIGDGGRRSPPRLIGVSLPCQKRVRHDKIWSLQL